MMIRSAAANLGLLACLWSLADEVSAQCGLAWQSFGPSTGQAVLSLLPLSSGDLLVGGGFSMAGGVAGTAGIAKWNGTTWSPLGTGLVTLGQAVSALAELPNGDIVAGGSFTSAGGPPVWKIARWDGSSWTALGSGLSSTVFAIQTLPNGDLVVGGAFTDTAAGGQPLTGLARWDGSAWSAFGAPLAAASGSAFVSDIELLPDGDVVVGGRFTSAGGTPAGAIARWDGSSWHALGSGLVNTFFAAQALSIHRTDSGDLIVGGAFVNAGGVAARNIARWDGAAWSALGQGLQTPSVLGGVYTVAGLPGGDIVAGGRIIGSGASAIAGLARWNGSVWSELAGGVSAVGSIPNDVNTLCCCEAMARWSSVAISTSLAPWPRP